MIDDSVYLVATPGDTSVPDDQEVAFFGNPADAISHRDSLGDNATVYRATPLPASAHWDWAVDHGHGPTVYVNERAARDCMGELGALMRRRRGTTAWEAVPR